MRQWVERHAVYAASIIALVSCPGCSAGNGNPGVQSSTKLTIGVQTPTGQNPAYGLRQFIGLFAFEGLTSLGLDGRAVPALATTWSKSADGLTWEITLRPNVQFQDGSPFNASTAKDLLDKVRTGPWTGDLPIQDIERVDTPNPQRLVIHLSRPSAFLLEDLQLRMTHGSGPQASGTGPFKLSSQTAQQVTLTANPNYYLGRPTVDQIDIRPYPTLRAAWVDLMRGRVDWLNEIGLDALDFVTAAKSVRVFTVDRPYAYVVLLNTNNPKLKSPLVRRALNAAVNREELVDKGLRGHGTPEYTPVWPRNWAYDASQPRFEYQPEEASRWLDQAGISVAAAKHDGSTAPARLTINCLVPNDYSVAGRLALMLQQQLRQIGVELNLESVSSGEFIKDVSTAHFEAALIDFIGGPGMGAPYWAWHSNVLPFKVLNYGGYSDTNVDNYLDQIRHANSDDEFRSGVSGFERSIVADPPAIFLAWGQTFRVVSRRFDVPPQTGRDIFESVRLWHEITARNPAEVDAGGS